MIKREVTRPIIQLRHLFIWPSRLERVVSFTGVYRAQVSLQMEIDQLESFKASLRAEVRTSRRMYFSDSEDAFLGCVEEEGIGWRCKTALNGQYC